MNILLFTALLIALIYYFFFYLPDKKSINPHPPTKLTHSQSTQTDNDEPTPQEVLNGPGPILNEPAALKPPEDTSALEKTIDQLIKSMTDLTKSLN